MPKTERPINQEPRYQTFTAQKDKALEKLNIEVQGQMVLVMDELKGQVTDVVSRVRMNPWLVEEQFFQRGLEQIFGAAKVVMFEKIMELRLATYTLSYMGEIEAISQGARSPLKADLTRERLAQTLDKDSPAGGRLRARIGLTFDRLMRKIIDAYQMGIVLDEPDKVAVARVVSAFPKRIRVKRPQRKLKKPKVKESQRFQEQDTFLDPGKADVDLTSDFRSAPIGNPVTNPATLTTGFVADDAWELSVKAYKLANLPPTERGAAFNYQEYRYDWELEKQITHDFVEQVRAGQVDAANDNGIKEFQWISVIDNDTDICCRWRDGLTTSEIKRQLKGPRSNDPCPDAVVPPAHMECRCTLAPVVKELPETEKETFADLDQWLNG